MCFEGRSLHGAPAEIYVPEVKTQLDGKRVTFLVNVLLNHKPEAAEAFEHSNVSTRHVPVRWTDPILVPQVQLDQTCEMRALCFGACDGGTHRLRLPDMTMSL
jgi:hypothetical protein